jgi:hypothetical protein
VKTDPNFPQDVIRRYLSRPSAHAHGAQKHAISC